MALCFFRNISSNEVYANENTCAKSVKKWQGTHGDQTKIAEMYRNGGYGITKNLPQAIVWYKKAAELGYDAAQSELSDIYDKELSVRDYTLAHMWLRISILNIKSRYKSRFLGELEKIITPIQIQIQKSKNMTLKWVELHPEKPDFWDVIFL